MKNLSWSILFAAAALTACSNEDLVSTENVDANLAKFNVPTIDVNLGGTTTLSSTLSENGGWTNFKKGLNDMPDKFDVRVLVQFFQNGTTTPIAQAVKFVKTPSEAEDDHVAIDGVKLPTGTYTAVTWVDFVKASDNNKNGTETDVDYFYETKNLSTVVDKADKVTKQDECMEARDAYTGNLTFTMDATGAASNVLVDDHQDGGTGSFCIQAKRKFAKIRVIMNDFATKAGWERYFSDPANKKLLNKVTSTFTGVSKVYNALTQTPITESTFNYSNTIEWGANQTKLVNTAYSVDGAAISWVRPTGTDNNVKFVSIDNNGYQALDVNDEVYPVLDYNYIIPASNDDAASYNMTYVAKTGDDAIKTMNLSNIPVRTNTLTTVFGPFLTYTLKEFKVYINDAFDQFKYADVTVNQNGAAIAAYSLGSVVAKVESDKSGNIIKITVGKIFSDNDLEGVKSNINLNNAEPITEANFTKMWEQLKALKNQNANTVIDMYVVDGNSKTASLPDDVNLDKADKEVNLTLSQALAKATTITSASKDINIKSTVPQSKAITVNAGDNNATIVDGNFGGAVSMEAAKATIEDGTFGKTVTMNANTATIEKGTYNGLVTFKNASGTANINGGTYAETTAIRNSKGDEKTEIAILSYSNTNLNGGSTAASVGTLYMDTDVNKTLNVRILGNDWKGMIDATSRSTNQQTMLNLNGKDGWDASHLGSNFQQ